MSIQSAKWFELLFDQRLLLSLVICSLITAVFFSVLVGNTPYAGAVLGPLFLFVIVGSIAAGSYVLWPNKVTFFVLVSVLVLAILLCVSGLAGVYAPDSVSSTLFAVFVLCCLTLIFLNLSSLFFKKPVWGVGPSLLAAVIFFFYYPLFLFPSAVLRVAPAELSVRYLLLQKTIISGKTTTLDGNIWELLAKSGNSEIIRKIMALPRHQITPYSPYQSVLESSILNPEILRMFENINREFELKREISRTFQQFNLGEDGADFGSLIGQLFRQVPEYTDLRLESGQPQPPNYAPENNYFNFGYSEDYSAGSSKLPFIDHVIKIEQVEFLVGMIDANRDYIDSEKIDGFVVIGKDHNQNRQEYRTCSRRSSSALPSSQNEVYSSVQSDQENGLSCRLLDYDFRLVLSNNSKSLKIQISRI